MRAAIYARVSSKRQKDEQTIDSQIKALREFARKHDYTIYNEYQDNGYSGELKFRPALDRLRDDLKKGLFDTVLIYEPDRLARKFIYQEVIIDEAKKYNVKFTFIKNRDNRDTPEDELKIGMLGIVAQYEKTKILDRSIRGKIHKAQNGHIVGGIPPYGYRYVLKDRRTREPGFYEIDQSEATVIKLIFDLFISKQLSIRGIIKELTARDITPRNGRQWRTSTLGKILRNETYAGVTYYNKNYSLQPPDTDEKVYRRYKNTNRKLRDKNEWVAIRLPDNQIIIPKSVFDKAQKQLKRNSLLSSRNTKHNYLLRGLMECENCGSPYGGEPSHGRRFYRCRNKHRMFPLPKTCSARSIRAEPTENAVWTQIAETLRNPKLIIDYLNARAEKASDISYRYKEIETELKAVQKEEERLLDGYREGFIKKDQLKIQMAKVLSKKSIITARQEKALKASNSDSGIPNPDSIKIVCKAISGKLNDLDFNGKQFIVRKIINRISVNGDSLKAFCSLPLDDPFFSGRVASPIVS